MCLALAAIETSTLGAWFLNEAAWDGKVDVLEEQLRGDLVLFASQDFALQPDLEDESSKVDNIGWVTNLLEQAFINVVTSQLTIYLFETAFV